MMASSWTVVCLLALVALLHSARGQGNTGAILGSDCVDTAGCGNIPNSLCGTRKGIEAKRCYCVDGYRPSDDLRSCEFVDVTRFARNTLNVGEWAGLFIGVSLVVLLVVTCVIHFRNKRNKNVEV